MASVTDEEPTSGDFMVLESTTSSPQEVPKQEEASREEMVQKCQEAILRLCSICGTEDNGKNWRPFRIVVVGKHGAGKSSFINGVAAALSEDSWHEYAYTGDLGRAQPITIVNQKLDKCSNADRERYKDILLPTFIDVAGLMDEADDKVEELLRLLFYGHIKENEPLMQVYEDIKGITKDEVRTKYDQSFPEMRVDRVIFVASASPDDPLPERLISGVHRAARPSHHRAERRAVPIYGVLTKMDKVDLRSSAYQEKKKNFMRLLGLNQSRFLVCSNYCDDLDPANQRSYELRPELDFPILRFMQLVCDRALKVTREDEVLPGSDGRSVEDRQNTANTRRLKGQKESVGEGLTAAWRAVDPMHRDAVMAAVIGLLTLLVLYVFVPMSSQGNAAWAQFKQRAWQIIVAAIVTVIVFLYQHINRRL